MPLVYIGAEPMLERTIELLNDPSIDISRVTAPMPSITYDFDRPIAVWGPVERPEFVIDEKELPY